MLLSSISLALLVTPAAPAELELLNGAAERAAAYKKLASSERKAIGIAVEWLVEHQSDDGAWDSDGFMELDPERDRCDGPGDSTSDTGVTGLALMALLGSGELLDEPEVRAALDRGLDQLVARQDAKTGLVGAMVGHAYLYGHAIATIALCEAVVVLERDDLRGAAAAAVRCVESARNPAGAWRYNFPPVGDNDTSVTAWMVTALRSAQDAGVDVEPEAFAGSISWIDEVTEADSGRVGYDVLGANSSRIPGINEEFPTELPTMTAVGLYARLLASQRAFDDPVVEQQAELLLASPPEVDKNGVGCDMYYWYYASNALHQLGGKPWKRWHKALKATALKLQRDKKSARGSWDPTGPWGALGGRVYSTAMMALCLEAPVRQRSMR